MTPAALQQVVRTRHVRGGVGPPHTVASRHRPQGCVCSLRRAPLLPASAVEDGRAHASGALLGLWLQTRWSVAKPDPDTPHGQSSRGAVEGEGRLPMASAAACYLLLWLHARFKTCNNLLLNKIVNSKKSQCCPALHGAYYSDSKNVVYFFSIARKFFMHKTYCLLKDLVTSLHLVTSCVKQIATRGPTDHCPGLRT